MVYTLVCGNHVVEQMKTISCSNLLQKNCGKTLKFSLDVLRQEISRNKRGTCCVGVGGEMRNVTRVVTNLTLLIQDLRVVYFFIERRLLITIKSTLSHLPCARTEVNSCKQYTSKHLNGFSDQEKKAQRS